MDIVILISLILAALSCVCSLVRQFQMFQQNSYFPSRYFKWVKESYTVNLAVQAIIFCLFSYRQKTVGAILIAAVTFILLICRFVNAKKTHKKSIKKLVLTARVKRLFAAAVLPLIAGIVLYVLFANTLTGEIAAMLTFAFAVVSPLTVMVAYILTLPIEKTVARWYINDAKKILRANKNLTVIGITGSFGKTTTKFILNRILSEKFNTVCTPQSFNTPMGVVRTVRSSIKPQTQIFVCEMGAKNVGDIKEICDIAHPKYGIITSVGAQHLDTFRSLDNVFKTKFELADEVKKNGGTVLINADSEGISSRISSDSDTLIRFGNGTKYFADNIKGGAAGSSFDLHLDGEVISVSTKLLGLHSINDILAAATLGYMLGVSADDIRFAISSLKPTEHRLELKTFGKGLLIDDAYNANPEGSLEAVHVLGSFEGMKKTIITPGLIELGEREYECNKALGREAAKYCDRIILVGKNRSKPLRDGVLETDFNTDNLYVVSSFKEAMEIYTPLADENSVVLLENDLPDNYLN